MKIKKGKGWRNVQGQIRDHNGGDLVRYGEIVTPYLMDDRFVANLRIPFGPGTGHVRGNRTEMAGWLLSLRRNKGKCLRFYGWYESPLTLLDWVEAHGYTLYRNTPLLKPCNGFTDFGGGVEERFGSFFYRIYDDALLAEIKQRLARLPFNRRQYGQ